MSKDNPCPYGSKNLIQDLEDYDGPGPRFPVLVRIDCKNNSRGWLCDRCKEDRKDHRMRMWA